MHCLFLSMVLWQEHLHQLFPSLIALPPHWHTAQILFHLQSWAFSALKMFLLQSLLATFVWGLEGNTLKPNKGQISAVGLSVSCSYIISLMLVIW